MKSKELVMVLDKNVVIKGCDVSYWQGNIDFKKMYNAGIRFVIIRAGYGSSTVDKNFVTYINAALAAGLNVGVYWFIYAKSEAQATNNAKMCEKTIAPYKDKIVCRVWCDYEYDSDEYAGAMTTAKRSAIVKRFLSYMETVGYEVGIYSNQDYIKSGKFSASLVKEYPLWFAKYSSSMGNYAERGLGGHPYIWQHTSSGNGRTYGVSSTYVDLNRGYFALKEEVSKETMIDKVQTDNSIIKASDNPYPEPSRVLRYVPGAYMQYGDDVKWAQWNFWRFGLLLDENGIPDAKQIDGYWGPDCDKAEKEAEQRLGLIVDGSLDLNDRNIYKSV